MYDRISLPRTPHYPEITRPQRSEELAFIQIQIRVAN